MGPVLMILDSTGRIYDDSYRVERDDGCMKEGTNAGCMNHKDRWFIRIQK